MCEEIFTDYVIVFTVINYEVRYRGTCSIIINVKSNLYHYLYFISRARCNCR